MLDVNKKPWISYCPEAIRYHCDEYIREEWSHGHDYENLDTTDRENHINSDVETLFESVCAGEARELQQKIDKWIKNLHGKELWCTSIDVGWQKRCKFESFSPKSGAELFSKIPKKENCSLFVYVYDDTDPRLEIQCVSPESVMGVSWWYEVKIKHLTN